MKKIPDGAKIAKAPFGEGHIYYLENGVVIQVLHYGDFVKVTNVSNHYSTRPNKTGMSIRMASSNEVKISEAR